MKKALIFGICGQDAAYMSQLLLDKGYEVHGVGRSVTHERMWRLDDLGITDKINISSGDITDASYLVQLFSDLQPDECYNFAAISFIGQSWKTAETTLNVNTTGVLHILEAIKTVSKHTRMYQAGSSEMFGRPDTKIQDESTLCNPCNPYGVSKLAAYNLLNIYRDAYGIFAANAYCYNHESPLRGMEYVTRKITDGVARISLGKQKELRLGNIEASRDWGHAKDYVQAMWAMLQQDKPDDYVLATGETHSIKDLLTIAFAHAGVDNWEQYVVEDERFYRPLEPHTLCGNSAKAKEKLQWEPATSFETLVQEMVDADMKRLKG
ncbi:GDP-mannose 4,6-dehydratase [Candidatus Parcubacteria bacterium]|jgi:GDPmannose 4,6-dehydratase|nr:GDP-mannose 4,6-dehydratase [Candidatus Parcubacteria bacterium]MBT3948970.1 GDP-mannose 4,6-dehydratase [Candidatus Parcubacteria bacterium]